MKQIKMFDDDSDAYVVQFAMWTDQQTGRPCLAITKGLERTGRSVMRFAMSPSAAVPFELLRDLFVAFEIAVTDSVIVRHGIAEDLELRYDQTYPQLEGGSSTSS